MPLNSFRYLNDAENQHVKKSVEEPNKAFHFKIICDLDLGGIPSYHFRLRSYYEQWSKEPSKMHQILVHA